MTHSLRIAAAVLCLAAFPTPSATAGEAAAEGLAKQQDQLQAITIENALLRDKIRLLENTPAITSERLAEKNLLTLREIARDTKVQRQAMADFENFVTWMTANLSGYAKYIQAGSIAAGFAKILPIPYAGQASVLTKFVSQGVLSLNTASVSIKKYLVTSQQFLTRIDTIDPARPTSATDISQLAHFADSELLRDMTDVHQKLNATSEISTSALSFLESVNAYVSSTDEYWNKTKSLVTRKEPDKKEKSYLSESIQNLKNGAGSFNARLRTFDDTVRKDGPLIKSVVAYDNLVRELAAMGTVRKMAKEGQ